MPHKLPEPPGIRERQLMASMEMIIVPCEAHVVSRATLSALTRPEPHGPDAVPRVPLFFISIFLRPVSTVFGTLCWTIVLLIAQQNANGNPQS